MRTQNGHNVPFLKSASFKKRKRNVMKPIKQFYKISKKGNKKNKKSCTTEAILDTVIALLSFVFCGLGCFPFLAASFSNTMEGYGNSCEGRRLACFGH